jgi:hypothetical protein
MMLPKEDWHYREIFFEVNSGMANCERHAATLLPGQIVSADNEKRGRATWLAI